MTGRQSWSPSLARATRPTRAGPGEDLEAAFGPGVGVAEPGARHVGHGFCGASGIRARVMAHQRAKAGNTEFLMVVPPGGVRRVLELRRLDTVLATYPAAEPNLARR
jgi:hypothetical protein